MTEKQVPIKRTDRELLEEILDTIRSQTRDKELTRQLPLFEEPEQEPVPCEPHPDWPLGLKVKHSKFGVGTVRKVEDTGDETKVIVWFDAVGPKKLLVRFAGLQRC